MEEIEMKKALRLSSLAIVLMALLTLTACAPKDAPAAKQKLEDKGYTVVADGTVIPTALKLVKVEGVETVLLATKKGENDQIESVTMILFKEKAQAKDSFEAVKDYAAKQAEKTSVKQAGKWLYYGTEQGMKDFA